MNPEEDSRRRILFVVTSLLGGGAEWQLSLLLRNVDRRRFWPHLLVLCASGEREAELRASGIDMEIHNFGRLWLPLGLCSVARAIKKFRPHIVHSWLFEANVCAGLAGRMFPQHLLITSRRDLDLWKKRRHVLLETRASRKALYITTNARFTAEYVSKQEGWAMDKIKVIPNAAVVLQLSSAEIRRATRQTLGFTADDLVIICVGTISRKKGHDILVSAFARTCDELPHIKLLVVGRGPMRDTIERTVAKMKLESRVKFTGYRNDVQRLLIASDILALASRWESQPNVIMEAMAVGLPVVATRVGGVPELVDDGVSGLLVDSEDEAQFAAALVRLVRDAELRKKLGVNGRQNTASGHSVTEMVKQYQSLYE